MKNKVTNIETLLVYELFLIVYVVHMQSREKGAWSTAWAEHHFF